ncbi:uncharacterized protein BDV14DRAFT_182803 [Aspergillus stella-maris]|uniref:uncharacterized protein n=1 Tax=Aspergillus stella-maris TaxID=1810926 RepID=UPI003CCD6875
MTDPISISGGVVGVVSLGVTVCQGLIAYYGPWKSYDDEINDFTTRLEGLQRTLVVIRSFISPEHDLGLPSASYRELVVLQLVSCEEACRRLSSILERCKSTETTPFVRKHDWLRLRRILYPFRKETLVTLAESTSGLQENLNLSLQLLNSALISRQHTLIQKVISTTTSNSLHSTRISNRVELNQMQSLIHGGSSTNRPTYHKILEPQTLTNLCEQQAVINTAWENKRVPAVSSSQPTTNYCTCRKHSYCASSVSISVCGMHKRSCPLYLDGHQKVAISAKYAFCNRLLGLSVGFMLTVARGAGALSISPAMQFHCVVGDNSPAFALLKKAGDAGYFDLPQKMEDLQQSLLQMYRRRVVAPTDRLADGSTLLHGVACMLKIPSCRGPWGPVIVEKLQELVFALIEMGVPVAEQTIQGNTALDIFNWHTAAFTDPWHLVHPAVINMQQRLLRSGSPLRIIEDPISGRGIPSSVRAACKYQTTQAVQTLVRNNAFEDIQISPIEMAILIKSEEALRECLLQAKFTSISDTHTGKFETLLVSCIGWTSGMALLLKSPPQDPEPVRACFSVACRALEFESASLLLENTAGVPLSYLRDAVESGNLQFLERVICLLASNRRRLHELALKYLPARAIRALGLPTAALLDNRSQKVYNALVQCGVITISGLAGDDYSVYSAILGAIPAAEMLYAAGFTDLAQYGGHENVPFIDISDWGNRSIELCVELAHWMVIKGADPYQPSIGGYPAIFVFAEEFSLHLAVWNMVYCSSDRIWRYCRKRDGTLSRECCSVDEIASLGCGGVLSTLLLNNPRDNCLCACSEGGCTPLLRLLKSFYEEIPYPHYIIKSWEIVYRLTGTSANRVTVSAAIRFFTFERLGMTHTCHRRYREKVERLDSEEISEIREEDFASIARLDELMLEFDQIYDELGVSMGVFLKESWEKRMDEVLRKNVVDPDYAIQVRKIGVVLSEEENGDDADDD